MLSIKNIKCEYVWCFDEKFQLFSLTFHFLSPQERDLHCSHDIMLRTKQTQTYTYSRFF